MRVLKREGQYENVQLDKITDRISNLCYGLSPVVDPVKVAIGTADRLYDGVPTEELDLISARIAEFKKLEHSDYGILAGRICVSNLHKNTPGRFSTCMTEVQRNLDILSPVHYAFIMEHADVLDAMIKHHNDYQYDYFGYKTLEKSYLLKVRGEKNTATYRIFDRPQYIYMRVAIAIFKDADRNMEFIEKAYNYMSEMYYTHASPTLFNACMKKQQLGSCFLLGTDDSIEGIMYNLSQASFISKWAGGIGIHMSNIRCAGSLIKGTNGRSKGLVRQLKIYNEAATCWDQGGDKRKGAFAIYLEPWHGDIVKFLELKKNTGVETERARDLFYALWVPDLFREKVENNELWCLFSEDTAPGLSNVYGDEFRELYNRYEREGRALKKIPARTLADLIFDSQAETGMPYICWKDHVNHKSNQKNIGIVKSSNLCTEIMEVSSKDSYATCTLSSINLKKYVEFENGIAVFNFEKLHEAVRFVTRSLDFVINVNKYPVKECYDNSYNNRPIGIGVQALADVFCLMRIPFMSDAAARLDKLIFETIYHAALTESTQLAREFGAYATFEGSPVNHGILQFDMWKEDLVKNGLWEQARPSMYDWDKTRAEARLGIRNSLLVALMPTVSTSQIMGNNESFEPFQRNMYVKTTLGGKFLVTNVHMIRHLYDEGLWTEKIRQKVVRAEGSLKDIAEIPQHIRNIYKSVWEIPQKEIMNRMAVRGAYVDQSASLNLHIPNPTRTILRGIFLHGGKLGLKTNSYYIRSVPAVESLKNNLTDVGREANTEAGDDVTFGEVCKKNASGEVECLACSS